MPKSSWIKVTVFFVLLTLAFFYKIFFGLIPLPTDLIVGSYHPWISQKEFSGQVPVHNPKLSDAVSIIYPLKVLAAGFEKKGQLPLWNPHMFGGYPLFASVDIGLLFPTMIFYLFTSPAIAWTIQTMFQPFLALIFMFILLRHFKLSILPSVFGSIAFAFGGFQILWLEWNTQATTSIFLPILIFLEDKFLITNKNRWGALFSIFFCFQILAGYMPVIIFSVLALILWYFIKVKFKLNLKFGLFVLLGIFLSSILLIPAWELFQISQRSVETFNPDGDFVPIQNLISFLAPDFFGNHTTGNFWGVGDYMNNAFYTGVIVFILALISAKNTFGKKEVRFAVTLLLISLTIVISNPVSQLLYRLGIWGGSSVSMNKAIFLINFSFSIMAAFALSAVKESLSKINLKLLIIPTLVLLVGYLLTLVLFENQAQITLRNIVFPFTLILTVAVTLAVFKYGGFNRVYLQIILIVILVFELFRFGLKFNTFSKTEFLYPKTAISELLNRFPDDRVISEKDIFPANMWVPLNLSSMQGYDSVYPLRVAKLLAVANSQRTDATAQPRWGVIDNFDSQIIDASNTRFILVLKRIGEINRNLQTSDYKKVFEDEKMVVLDNTKVFPRVYLTEKVIKVNDEEALEEMIRSKQLKEVTLGDDLEFNNRSDKRINYNLDYQQITNSHNQIKTSSNKQAFLVVLNSFYPGWKAYVDGKETKIHRTNYNFQGIIISAGNHIVDFKYQPDSLKFGAIISLITLIIIISLLIYPVKSDY